MNIAYAAHTRGCSFHVDDDGVCRRVLAREGVDGAWGEHTEMQRCVGARLVGALEGNEQRLMVAQPDVGTSMLFALSDADARGRGLGAHIELVRTAPVERLEAIGESGVHARIDARRGDAGITAA